MNKRLRSALVMPTQYSSNSTGAINFHLSTELSLISYNYKDNGFSINEIERLINKPIFKSSTTYKEKPIFIVLPYKNTPFFLIQILNFNQGSHYAITLSKERSFVLMMGQNDVKLT